MARRARTEPVAQTSQEEGYLGGQILVWASWRAIFWTLVGVGLLTLAALFALPETLPPERRNAEPLGHALVRYVQLLRERHILGYALEITR